MRPTLVTPANVALVQKQEANPYAYPARISSQLVFVNQSLKYGQLPTQNVSPVIP
jgi:hypothetical protein